MLQVSFTSSQRPPVWLVKQRYSMGSDRGCDIWLNDPAAGTQHAELLVNDDVVQLIPRDDHSISVNDQPVLEATQLEHGFKIRVGDTVLSITDSRLKRQESRGDASEGALNGWYLQGTTTALSNKQYPVRGEIIVGRAKDCDVTLAVAHLSRRHARIRVKETYLEIEDLGSVNGTYLNRQAITKTRAHIGDEVRFDTLSFRVCHRYETTGQEEYTSLRFAARPTPGSASPEETPPSAAFSKASAKQKKKHNQQRFLSESKGAVRQQGSLASLFLGFLTVACVTLGAFFYLVRYA